MMQRRTTQHKISAGCADLNTIRQQPNMLRLSVLATLSEAVVNGRKTDLMTVRAFLDAFAHVAIRIHGGPR